MGRPTLLLLLLFSMTTITSAQRQRSIEVDPNALNPTLGNGATLVVHVVQPNDRPLGQDYSVVLESVHGAVVGRSVTNRQGEIAFRGIRPGDYVVRVSGANIKDAASGTIALSPSDFRSEFVRVELTNPDGTPAITSKQGSVSAASLNIPEKARKERDKGNEALARGDKDKAKEHYLKAIEIYPAFASAYNNLGTVYIASSDKVHAREAWMKALEIDPELDSANVNIARLDFMDRDYASAITPLEKALAAHPKNPNILLLMSEAQLMTKDYDKALVYARKVYTGVHKDFEMAHIVAGRALEAQNHPDQARAEYDRLLQESPSAPETAEAKRSLSRLDSLARSR